MKRGISLVALVITIIVLIILTAAVVLTGGDAPDQAKKAVFFNDVATIQDAVTIKMTSNIAAMYDPTIDDDDKPDSKLDGIIDSTDEGTTLAGTTVTVYGFAEDLTAADLNVTDIDLDDYSLDANGKVYFTEGKTFDGKTYYSRDLAVEQE